MYTPGPYELRGPRTLTDAHGVILADSIGCNHPGTAEDTARLLSAATELADCLSRCLEYMALTSGTRGTLKEDCRSSQRRRPLYSTKRS